MTGDEPQGTMGRAKTAGEVSPVVSFPPSFARTFSSKERRLGTSMGSWYKAAETHCMTALTTFAENTHVALFLVLFCMLKFSEIYSTFYVLFS